MVKEIMSPLRPTLLVLVSLLAGPGCSDRPRSNPLDPRNTDSENANAGFNALAGNEQVLLLWDQLSFEDLRGIRVQRVTAGTSDTVTLNDSSLSTKTTFFLDNGVENGTSYYYNLQFVLNGSSERPKTLPDIATPGQVFGWVELVDYGEVILMTPDFRDEISSLNTRFLDIVDIQVGPEVWILDGSAGQISQFTLNGEPLDQGSGLRSVGAFRFNRQDGTVWVAIQGASGFIYHFTTSGQLISSFSTSLPVTSIAANNLLGEVWVGSASPEVARINPIVGNIVRYSHSDFIKPELVVDGLRSRLAYVLDYGSRSVFQLDNNGVVWKVGGFSSPSDILADESGTLLWVTDPEADKLYEIDSQGKITSEVSGLGRPHRMAYNNLDQTLYVTGAGGLISNLSPGGQVNWQVNNSVQPGRIALQYAR